MSSTWYSIHLAVLCVVLITRVSTKSVSLQSDEESDASLLIRQFCQTVESTINHLVVTRDMHKHLRQKRQLNNFGAGNFGQGSLGGFGQGSNGVGSGLGGLLGQGGDFLGGISNIANLASLDSLGSGAASGLPVL